MVAPCTGLFLTGPFLRPDLIGTPPTITVNRGSDGILLSAEVRGESPTLARLNMAGYIPIVSLVTGGIRFVAGLVHTIYHFAKSVFEDKSLQKDHIVEAALGFYNCVRGVIEMVPVGGNLLCFLYDQVRIAKFDLRVDKAVLPIE